MRREPLGKRIPEIQCIGIILSVRQTWATVTSKITNFLQDIWKRGGLIGAKVSDAFTIRCGLRSTMTTEDILNGYMIVRAGLQIIRPAEFIELTIRKKMQGA